MDGIHNTPGFNPSAISTPASIPAGVSKDKIEAITSDFHALLKAVKGDSSELKGYTNFSTARKAIQDHIIQTVGYCATVYDYANLFLTHNDVEGLDSLRQMYGLFSDSDIEDNKPRYNKLFESAFASRDINTIELFMKFIPITKNAEFLTSKLYEELQCSPDIQEHMIKCGYCPTDWEKQIHQDRFSTIMKHRFPILTLYKFPDRAINEERRQSYGDLTAHDKYLNLIKGSVEQMLFSIDSKRSFLESLEGVAIRRRSIADFCKSPSAEQFGAKKNPSSKIIELYDTGIMIPEGALMTPVYNNAYSGYGPKLLMLEDQDVRIKIGDKDYVLTRYAEDAAIIHCYVSFFEKDDPVYAHVEDTYKKITSEKYESQEALHKDIAYFHWLLVNVVCYARGTSSVAEVMTDAMWLHHGYIPNKEPGLDLVAQTSPNFEDFLKVYPQPLQA